MKFRTPLAPLVSALAAARNVADRHATMDQLKTARLVVRGSTLTVSATDLNVSVTTALEVSDAKPGSVALDAKLLHAAVAALPGDEVTLETDANHHATIAARRVRNRIPGVSDAQCPKLPNDDQVPYVTVDAAVLADMLDRVAYAACKDQTRFHLNGVLVEPGHMVATDGHRLALVERELALTVPGEGVIVPSKGVTELRRMLDGGTVQVALSGLYLFMRREGTMLAVKLIDAKFPPWRRVIPQGAKRTATIDRASLAEAMRRVRLVASEKGARLGLDAEGLRISCDSPDVGSSEERLECEWQGEPIEIGMNPRYLSDALEVLSDERVTLALGEELDPIKLLTGDTCAAVIMPMRV